MPRRSTGNKQLYAGYSISRSESLAAGSDGFFKNAPTLLGTKATNRKAAEMADKHSLGVQSARYKRVSGT